MLNQTELMEALFPKQVAEMKTEIIQNQKELIQHQNELIQMQNEKIQMQNEKIQIVRNMKEHGDDLEYISKITNIPLEKIKEI